MLFVSLIRWRSARRPVGRMKASVEKTAPPKQEDVPLEIPNQARVMEIANGTAFRYHPRAAVGRDITFTIVGKTWIGTFLSFVTFSVSPF